MTLNIQLTPEDYIKANFIHMRPRPVIKWAGCFILLLAVVVVGFSSYDAIAHKKGIIVPVIIIVSLAYLAIFFFIFQPRRIRKIFQQQKILHKPFSFIVTDEAICTKADFCDAKQTWNYFLKWKEGKELFLLYQSDVLFHMVPKRHFASPEEITLFRQLLHEKIGPAMV